MTSALSIPCREVEVTPRFEWPSCLCMTFSGCPRAPARLRERDGAGAERSACGRRPGLRAGAAPAHAGLRPRPPAGRAGDDAEQRTGWQLEPLRGPRTEVLPAPVVHPTWPAVALAAADQQRAAARVEVALVEVERLLDPQAARARARRSARASDRPRDRRPGGASPPRSPRRWAGRRVAQALVARGAPAMELRVGRRRAPATSDIEGRQRGHVRPPRRAATTAAALPPALCHRRPIHHCCEGAAHRDSSVAEGVARLVGASGQPRSSASLREPGLDIRELPLQRFMPLE